MSIDTNNTNRIISINAILFTLVIYSNTTVTINYNIEMNNHAVMCKGSYNYSEPLPLYIGSCVLLLIAQLNATIVIALLQKNQNCNYNCRLQLTVSNARHSIKTDF